MRLADARLTDRLALALVAVAAMEPFARADVLPTMTAAPALGGLVRTGRIMPLTVSISNTEVGFRGQVVASAVGGKQRSVRAIDLPPLSRKKVTLYLDVASYESDFTAELMAPLRVASAEVAGIPVEEPRVVAVAVGSASWGLRGLAADDVHPLTVVQVSPDEMPDRWYGWDAADVVLWGDVAGAPPTAEQGRALAAWVQMGGTLVLASAAEGSAFASVRELLPASVAPGPPALRRDVQAALGLEPGGSADESVPVARLVPGPNARVGRSLATPAGAVPLLVEGSAGMGRVLLFGVDPEIAFQDAAGIESLWVDLLPVPEAPDGSAPRQERWDRVMTALQKFVEDIPPLKPISLTFLLLFMAAYVIVVGPLDYFVLKRLGRMTLTWVTYPVAIVVFSAIAYGFASAMKGSEMVVSSVQIIDGAAGDGPGRRTALTGIFAVERAIYPARLPGDGSALAWDPSGQSPGSGAPGFLLGRDVVLREDDGAGASLSLPINIFTMERVVSRELLLGSRVVPMPFHVQLGPEWMAAEGWRDVAVRNATSAPLRGVMVVGPRGTYMPLGDIGPGMAARVSGVGRTPMKVADTANSGINGSWSVRREPETGRLSSVSGGLASALALAITSPGGKSSAIRGSGLAFLDFSRRLEDGAFVVLAHTYGHEPSPVAVRGRSASGQALLLWRQVVEAPAVDTREEG